MRIFPAVPWLILLLSGCSDGSGSLQGSRYAPIPAATLEAPPAVGEPFVAALNFDLADVGYEAGEYFIAGTASSFTSTTEETGDGQWAVEPFDEAAYMTRVLVHRPSRPEDFSGTVIVEWLNVTGGVDAAPGYVTGHLEVHRAGHVWVGVSAQVVGIEGGGVYPLNLKAVDPARYGGLSHPGDQYSYDIFTQVAGLLRNPGAIDPLRGLKPKYVWAVGESQSAFRLTTYINALQPYYDAFDGYLVFSRGGAGAPLQEEGGINFAGAQRIREDLDVPVLTFQTETDLLGLGYLEARQEDSANFRLWEVAGTAHADVYTAVTGPEDVRGEPRFAAVTEVDGYYTVTCDNPINSGPMHFVFDAAVRALDDWVRTGAAPPPAPRLDLNDDGTDFLRDEFGNATGGIRTPHVDAPVATLRGDGNSNGFCFLFGTTTLFGPAEMASLYVDAQGYTAAVRKSADAAVNRGHLVREDADAIVAWAPEQWSAQVGQ